MGVPAGDAVRAEAFRAYVGRCGAVLWTRAVVLAAGDRAQAGAWWAGALATTYGAWGPDADDAVETHLALRAMSRQAARAGSAAARVGRGSPEPEPEPEPEPAPGAGDGATNVAPGAGDAASNVAPRSEGAPVDPSSRSGGRPPERSAERTWRRLAGLDAPARAALVTACLDEIGAPAGLGLGLREADEPGGVAVSRAAMLLDRRVREVRADLARGLAAWPARTGLAVVAAALREAAQEADPPDAALIDGVLRGDGGVSAAEDRASGSAGGPGRWKRWWRRRRTASRARGRPSRAAVTLVGAVALLGALAGARQLASSAPRDQSPAPQASMADPTPSQARVQLADLPVGAPLHPRTWFHERYVGGRQVFVYADAAGEVPLPTSPAIVGEPAVVALTPRGALLTVAVSDAGPSGRGVGGSRVLAIGADRAVRVVAEGPLVGVTASRDGRWVAYGLTRPTATPQPAGSLPSDRPVVAAVTEVATSTTTTQAATGLPVWAGDRVLVDGVGGPFVWEAATGWTRSGAGPGGRRVSAGTGVVSVVGVPGVNGCLKWWVDPATQARDIACDQQYGEALAASPDGRTVLVTVLAPLHDTAVFAGIDAVDLRDGSRRRLRVPVSARLVGGMTASEQAWEDATHVILVVPPQGPARTPEHLRCDVTSGACERVPVPDLVLPWGY